MFSIKSVYITVPPESHNTILFVLTSMVHVALRQITAQYQIQISDENTCIHNNTDRVTNITDDILYSAILIHCIIHSLFSS